MFFDGAFGVPLTGAAAGEWARPLEMVRRGPSANNKQSWRVVLDHGPAAPAAPVLHLYKVPSMGYESLDAGIALCHFEQTCHELNLPGHWETLPDAPPAPKAAYLATWVGK
jgi:hypothetical protein